MGLQDSQVGLAGVAIVGDVPPNALQPVLPDGIHLRWAATDEVAFPWYGYYLFRREHRPGKAVCFSQGLTGYSAGDVGATTLTAQLGVARSDTNLALTEDFPPANRLELDLAGRRFLQIALDPRWYAREAQVAIGFREDCGIATARRTCIDFRKVITSGKNPVSIERARFIVRDADGRPVPRTTVKAWRTHAGELRGLDCGHDLEVTLPCPAREVDLRLTPFAAAVDCEGLTRAGKVVAHTRTRTAAGVTETVRLSGRGIELVRLRAKGDEAALHELCFVCEAETVANPAIEVKVYDDETVVATASAAGRAGQEQALAFELDRITAVTLSAGPAALIDLCVTPIAQDAQAGWQALPQVDYPIALPARHPDYPARQGAADPAGDQTLALGRVMYGPSATWSGTPFDDLHDALISLVVGGPGSAPMAQRTVSVPGTAVPPDTVDAPTMPSQQTYGLVMLGSLNPAVAQMLGLYWVDATADPATAYDYLIVADSQGVGQLDVNVVLGLVGQGDWSQLDGHIVYNLRKVAAPALDPPTELQAYALPGTTVAQQGGGLADWSNNAGLTWDIPATGSGGLLPGSAVLYHVWRTALGDADQPQAPAGYDPITEDAPVLVVAPQAGDPPSQSPSDWPPFPLQYIDTGLQEGWYGYELNGIDIFGRHSVNTAAAPWRQWAPEPQPRPWYYVEPAADRVVHPSAVRLEDAVAPPPPAGLGAWALDPQDPFLTRDAAYDTWYASLSVSEQAETGLRVRWQWTYANQRQAPDTREFRIYYQPGRFNAMLGTASAVSAVAGDVSEVMTDIVNAEAADALAGAFLQMGARSFRVIGNEAGSPLVLRVQNTTNPTDPAPGTGPCAVTVPPNQSLWVDTSVAANWQQRRYVVAYADNVTVTTDADGNPLRTYEVLLPAPGDSDRSGLALTPTIADPLAYGAVGLTAADDKTYVEDAAKWDGTEWGERYGNESFITGPATVVVVFRGPVPAPVIPADSDAVFASEADYHSHSFFTYRWPPLAATSLHVFRAMDDAVFSAWWTQGAPPVSASDDAAFPNVTDEPRWNHTLRQAVADDIGQLAGQANIDDARSYFHGRLSHDALRVLAGLELVSAAYSQITIQALDPEDPGNADRPGPDTPSGYAPDPGLRAYIDTLDGRSSNRWFYRCAYVDGAHNVSALSLATPPVYLPDVVAPRAPVITSVSGDDGSITLTWASNREPDLAEYVVYRAADEASAGDIRLMNLVHTDPDVDPDPTARPASASWTDDGLVGGSTWWYRLVAVDGNGNASVPSAPVKAVVVDERPPEPPLWKSVTWVVVHADGSEGSWPSGGSLGATDHAALRIEWTAQGVGESYRLTRRQPGDQLATPVAIGTGYEDEGGSDFGIRDDAVSADRRYVYSIAALSPAGVPSLYQRDLQVPAP
ncbi:MAG TPA: hypothetical protein VNV17_23885 [Solirubrobacteraceae bacterium]|jgi:hypothetical protein|nr:hypothetical protein [Solirubrobacteraceae bacterium]